MLAKVVFVALLACTAVAMAADVEAAADTETASATTAEQHGAVETTTEQEAEATAAPGADPKLIKPQMHPRGGLHRGHVKPYPVGYDARHWRAPRYAGGGRAPTTEQLLFPYRHHADTRTEVEVKGEKPGPYPWETPEYEADYVQRTGNSARDPVPRTAAKALPVVHYPRGTHHLRPGAPTSLRHHGKPRRANTPRPARRPYIPARPGAGGRRGRGRRAHHRRRTAGGRRRRGGRRAGRRVGPRRGARKAATRAAAAGKKKAAKKTPAAAAAAKKTTATAAAAAGGKKKALSLADKVERLEKTMTFALRELGRHLGRMRKLETFAKKGKTAITLIAKALQKNQARANANQARAAQTAAQIQNLHVRSKNMNALLKKHKAAIALIAKEFQSSRRTNRAAIARNAATLKQYATQTGALLAAQRNAILANDAHRKADERQVAANQLNTAALHKAATNAQAAILNLDRRLKATTKLANKEKKAFQLVFQLLNKQKSELSQIENQRVQAARKGTGH